MNQSVCVHGAIKYVDYLDFFNSSMLFVFLSSRVDIYPIRRMKDINYIGGYVYLL